MPDYDVITVGGGLGGAALGKVLAEKGLRVLVTEREVEFKDRIRGETMAPWGVAEAQKLGLYRSPPPILRSRANPHRCPWSTVPRLAHHYAAASAFIELLSPGDARGGSR